VTVERAGLFGSFAAFPDRLAEAAEGAQTRPVADGEWGPAEVVRHLIAVEREVWWMRFGSLAAEDEPQWSWMEPGLEPGLQGAPLAEVLTRFADARGHSVAILDGFDAATWARTGVHATFGRLDALGLLAIVTDHDAEHLRGLTAASLG
jgi:DinB superfamily